MAPLTPESVAFLAGQAGLAPWPSLTPQAAREQHLAARRPDAGAPVVPIADDVIESTGAAIRMRTYGTPDGRPVLVFAHGGGWVYGDLDMADGFCRKLAASADVTVCSVDYRLAPEHPFPAPLEDAVLGTEWAGQELGGGAPIGLVGSSAGGNLAAATCLVVRDSGGPGIGLQVLMTPVTNYAFDTQSYAENASGKFLEADDMRWYWQQYLAGGADGASPLASVLRADVSRLPPALVITAEHDVLRDEGEAYAERLGGAGVEVRLKRFDGLIHAFPTLAAFPSAQAEAISAIDRAVGRWLRVPSSPW